MPKVWLTAEEAAEVAGVSTWSIYAAARDENVRSKKMRKKRSGGRLKRHFHADDVRSRFDKEKRKRVHREPMLEMMADLEERVAKLERKRRRRFSWR